MSALTMARRRYADTPDADPRDLYHDVRVAIDEERRLGNGWLDPIERAPGESVVHGNERLRTAFGRGGEAQVSRLRLDDHTETGECWLHAPDFGLSSWLRDR